MEFGVKEKYSRAWFDINYLKGITKCKCIDNFFIGGKEIVITTISKAKCSPQDKFNEEFGKALSMVRCRRKANRKIEKLLIQYSNRKPKEYKLRKGHQQPNDNIRFSLPADVASKNLDKTILIIGKDMYKLERISNE